jgi:hypothetical protein
MRHLLIPVVFGLLGAVAAPEPSPLELEYARKKLAAIRPYPDELARIREAAEKLDALPPERQTQLRQLDHDLHQQPSAAQARLQDVLDRYNEWFAHLDPKDQDRIRQAPDRQARLAVIRQIRQGEWLITQPKALRDKLIAFDAPARDAAISKAWREERQRQAEWAVARRFWDDMAKNKPLPAKLDDFDNPTKTYITEVLYRLLSKDEKDRLTKVEGQWPQYPQTLVEFADRHPPALPSENAPRTFAELPKPIRDILSKKALKSQAEKRLRPFEGRFPDFAIHLAKYVRETKDSKDSASWPYEWWAYGYNALSAPMQEFVKKKLVEPLLDRKEYRMLLEAEGVGWPDYPETIQKLADLHHLQVPWYTLPGGRERWDAYRAGKPPIAPGYPELPRYKLQNFVFLDLDDTDRKKLQNEILRTRARGDGEAWGSIVESYFQRYPSELSRLRAIDRAKAGLKEK